MKTPEETLKYITQMGYTGGVEAIKAYGKQCAEQALNDAADNHKDDHSTLSGWENAIKRIRSTPILTP